MESLPNLPCDCDSVEYINIERKVSSEIDISKEDVASFYEKLVATPSMPKVPPQENSTDLETSVSNAKPAEKPPPTYPEPADPSGPAGHSTPSAAETTTPSAPKSPAASRRANIKREVVRNPRGAPGECLICFKPPCDVTLLSCDHQFCYLCIHKWHSHTTEHNKLTLSCPVCQSVTDLDSDGEVPRRSDDDVKVVVACKVCEDRQAWYYCEDCLDPLCATCKERHHKGRFCNPAYLYEVDAFECPAHEEAYFRVCTDCDRMVCKRCMYTSHDHHSTEHLFTVAEEKKAALDKAIAEVNSKSIPAQGDRFTVEKVQTCMDDVNKFYAHLRDIMDKEQKFVIGKLTGMMSDVRKQDVKDKRNVFFDEQRWNLSGYWNKLKVKHPQQILHKYDALSKRARALSTYEIEKSDKVLTSIKLNFMDVKNKPFCQLCAAVKNPNKEPTTPKPSPRPTSESEGKTTNFKKLNLFRKLSHHGLNKKS